MKGTDVKSLTGIISGRLRPGGVTEKDTEEPDNVLTSKSLPRADVANETFSLSKNEIKGGNQIIGNLDQNGYLWTVAEMPRWKNVSEEYAESVCKKFRNLIRRYRRRNLQECLLIQARMMGAKRNPIVEAIIRDHLKDLELKNYLNIARKLKVPIRGAEKAVLLISNMDPKTGVFMQRKRFRPLFPMFM